MRGGLLAGGAVLLLAAAIRLVLGPGGATSWSRLGRAYDASRPGRRLEARLANAGIELRSSEWRLAQLFALPPLIALATLTGAGPSAAMLLPFSAVRIGGAVLLWLRRGRLTKLRAATAVPLARALAAEFAAGASGARAIEAAAWASAGAASPLLGRLLRTAAAGVSVGQDGVTALEGALRVRRDRDGHVQHPDALSAVAAGFAAQARLGASGAPALHRLGDALEDAARTRAAARAATAEARLAAVSVPLVASAAGLLLVGAEPRALATATTLPGFLLVVGCGVTAAAGVGLVSVITRV